MARHFIAIFLTALTLFCVSRAAVASEVTAKLELVNAANVPPGIVDDGVYAGPYTAGIVGTNGTVGATFPIICDNYDKDVSIGITWSAISFQLSDPNAFNSSVSPHLKLLGDSTAAALLPSLTPAQLNLQSYEAAAWLAQQIMIDDTSSKRNDALVADLNWAIWAIFSATADTPTGSSSFGGFDKQAQKYYQLALTQTYNVNQFSDVTFWTPVPGDTSQEYITVTPEPATLLLFGTGLLGIALLMRRKQLSKQ